MKAGGEKLRCGTEYRLPVRSMDSMSVVNCRKLMKEYGLSEDGSKVCTNCDIYLEHNNFCESTFKSIWGSILIVSTQLKEDMKARYRALELKVNSEVDRCPGRILSAQTLARMAKDVEYDERKRLNTKNEIRRSKTRHCLWLKNGGDMGKDIKADYLKLVEQVKAFKDSGHAGAEVPSTAVTSSSSSVSLEKGDTTTTDMSNGSEIKLHSSSCEDVLGVVGQWIPYSSSPWSFSIPENCTPFFYNSETGEWQLEVPEDVEADRRRLVEEIDTSVSHHMCFIPTRKFLTVVDQNPPYQYKDSTVNDDHYLVMRNLAAAAPGPHSTTQDSFLGLSQAVDDGSLVSPVHSSPLNHATTLSSSESGGLKGAKVLNSGHKPSRSDVEDDTVEECSIKRNGKGSIQDNNKLSSTTSDFTTGEAAERIEATSDEKHFSDISETIWECSSCTFHNTKMDAIHCDICLYPRPITKLKSGKIQGRKKQTTIVGISMGHRHSKRQKSAKR